MEKYFKMHRVRGTESHSMAYELFYNPDYDLIIGFTKTLRVQWEEIEQWTRVNLPCEDYILDTRKQRIYFCSEKSEFYFKLLWC